MKRLATVLITIFVLIFGGMVTISAANAANNSNGQNNCRWDSFRYKCSKPATPKPSATPSATASKSPKPTASAAPSTSAPSTPAPTQAPAPAPTTAPAPPAAGGSGASNYPLHTNVVSTTFWVGEIFNASLADGSQVCSTYHGQWAFSHTGINKGTVPSSAEGCAGSIIGGCDGVSSGSGTSFKCATERRDASNGYFPKTQPTPLENPFYLDLPYDDLNDPTAFKERCTVIPWAAADNAATGKNNCANGSYSYMKNHWVELTGPNGNTCYGQVEDAGPSSGSLYHDKNYVFGTGDARPANTQFSADKSQGAGADVSPALNGCLGFSELDGSNDHVSWRFIDAANVPAGPWLNVVTTSGVQN
ncbi:hypothetical protein [Arthrobacter sp. 35W]|uniref:hypothetical protein n=1 Tax=Arthrobacter sp. 35W TaxID=1132441 RepID=UPI0004118A01|nr:hypothetical protein [Arthrobacter sp. 35W]